MIRSIACVLVLICASGALGNDALCETEVLLGLSLEGAEQGVSMIQSKGLAISTGAASDRMESSAVTRLVQAGVADIWMLLTLALIFACTVVGISLATSKADVASHWRTAARNAIIGTTLVLSCAGVSLFVMSKIVKGTGSTPGYTKAQLFGLECWLWLGPVCAVLGVSNMMNDALNLKAGSYGVPLGGYSTGVFLCIVAAVVGGYMCHDVLFRCGVLWCSSTGSDGTTGTIVSLGMILFFITAGMCGTFLSPLVASPEQAAPIDVSCEKLRDLERARRSRRAVSACVLAFVIIPFLVMICSMLPNALKSMDSSDIGTTKEESAEDSGPAEETYAWLVTLTWQVSSNFYLNFYPDIIIFYGFLWILAVTALAALAFPPFGRILAKPCFRSYGISLGEVLIAISLLVTTLLFGFYWLFQHEYHNGKAILDKVFLERTFRTCGMLAVFFMALLILPASKNSLWHTALGVSWENGLWVHRVLGQVALVFMLLHILFVWIRFVTLGTFPYDAFAMILYYISVDSEVYPSYDNYTIAMQEMVAYPAIIMISTFLWRRSGGIKWEIFKYLHYVFLVLIPSTLFHAESSWYFLLGGVVFWLFDAATRFFGVVSKPAHLVSAEAWELEDGVSVLTLNRISTEPGGFVWIKVPEISEFEWHPFSVCSAAPDTIQLCIKSMGQGTFTGQLFEKTKAVAENGYFDVQVDGPYGPAFMPNVGAHVGFVLLAGGIGITQSHSVFRFLSRLAASGGLPGDLRFVHLVWTAKEPNMFSILSASLQEGLRELSEASGVKVSITLQATNTETQEIPVMSLPLGERGRPDFRQIFDDIVKKNEITAEETFIVQACGPGSMVEAASNAALDWDIIEFQSAAFAL